MEVGTTERKQGYKIVSAATNPQSVKVIRGKVCFLDQEGSQHSSVHPTVVTQKL